MGEKDSSPLKSTSFPLCYLCHRGPGSSHLLLAGVYFCTFTQKEKVGISKSPAPGSRVERVIFEVLVEILVGGLAEHAVQVLPLLQHPKRIRLERRELGLTMLTMT